MAGSARRHIPTRCHTDRRSAAAAAAVDAGASFIVAPGFNPAVGRWCVERGVPYVPGVATPTEIEAAMALGLTTLKFFPAEASGGAKALKAISAPYSAVRFMPTGGITAANAREYLALKTVLCVGGSWMVPSDAVQKLESHEDGGIAASASSLSSPSRTPALARPMRLHPALSPNASHRT